MTRTLSPEQEQVVLDYLNGFLRDVAEDQASRFAGFLVEIYDAAGIRGKDCSDAVRVAAIVERLKADAAWRQVAGNACLVGLCLDVARETSRAMDLHKPLRSAHESYAAILEELDEFWEEVRKRSSERSNAAMRKELIHTAAMCVRAIHDLGL